MEFAGTITRFLTEAFLSNEFDKIHVIYTQFHSTLKQEAIIRQLFPIIDLEIINKLSDSSDLTVDEYLFEPSADLVLEAILPHYILMEIYQILLDSSASEHSAPNGGHEKCFG